MTPPLSAVVPTLEEAPRIERTLRAARRALGPEAELVVADGGSRDGTPGLAAPLARVVASPRGRGAQLNAGAAAARGRILLFLHADTVLPPGAGEEILRAGGRPGVAGGCLRFAVDPPAEPLGLYRLLEVGVNLRTRIFRTATGDQAIFATRAAFEGAGGFPEIPLFEDVAFVRRLKAEGSFAVLDVAARTSRRRWERGGFFRTVLLHWALRAAWAIGIPAETLADWYPAGRGDPDLRDRSPG